MAKDWRVIIDDTGGPDSGWPSVWSDEEDRSVIHVNGFHQQYWQGPTKKESMQIAQLVVDFMNNRSV